MPFLDEMPALADEIIFEEGLRLEPYKDTLGLWTVGVGHLLLPADLTKAGLPKVTTKWTRADVLHLLDQDLRMATRDLHRELPWTTTLDPVRERVLINMCFQMGITKLLGFKNTLAAIREGNYGKASEGMLASLWAKQTPARALRMATRMRTGRYFVVNVPKERTT